MEKCKVHLVKKPYLARCIKCGILLSSVDQREVFEGKVNCEHCGKECENFDFIITLSGQKYCRHDKYVGTKELGEDAVLIIKK